MRFAGLDLLRGIAAFGIVACHLMLFPSTVVAERLVSFCDFFVAVFAAISGFVMTDKIWEQSFFDYAKKRAERILPAYLFGSFVYVVMSAAFKIIGHEPLMQYKEISFWLSVSFKGGASCHLWFLICLLYGQLALRLLPRQIFSICASCILSLLFVYIATLNETWYCKYFSRLIAFLIFGLFLREFWARCRCHLSLMMGLTIITVILHFVLKGLFPAYVRDMMAVGPFVLLFANLNLQGERISRIATIAAETSLGVFLVHPLITKALGLVFKRFCGVPYGVVATTLDWGVCWVIAFLLTFFASKLPYIQRVVK